MFAVLLLVALPSEPNYRLAEGFKLEPVGTLKEKPYRIKFKADGSLTDSVIEYRWNAEKKEFVERLPETEVEKREKTGRVISSQILLDGISLRGSRGATDFASDAVGNAFILDDGKLFHALDGSDLGFRETGRVNGRPGIRTALVGDPLAPINGGMFIFDQPTLPAPFRGRLFAGRGPSLVATELLSQGATFKLGGSVTVLTAPANVTQLRVTVGPDDAVYVCEHPTGKLFRLTWAGGKTPGDDMETPALPVRGLDGWSKIIQANDADIFTHLTANGASDRRLAAIEIVKRGGPLFEKLTAIIKDPEAAFDARVGGIRAYEKMPVESIVPLLQDEYIDIRRLAAERLAQSGTRGDEKLHEKLLAVLGDEEPSVKRAIALAIAANNAPGSAELLVNAYKLDKGECPALTEGLVVAIARTGKPGLDKLIELGNSGSDSDLTAAVAAFRMMRSPASTAASVELFANPHLKDAERIELVKAFLESPDRSPLMMEPLKAIRAQLKNPSVELEALFVEALGK